MESGSRSSLSRGGCRWTVGNRFRKPGWLTRPRVRFLHPPPTFARSRELRLASQPQQAKVARRSLGEGELKLILIS